MNEKLQKEIIDLLRMISGKLTTIMQRQNAIQSDIEQLKIKMSSHDCAHNVDGQEQEAVH